METLTRYIERDDFSTVYSLSIPKGDILNKKVKMNSDFIKQYNDIMSKFTELQNKLEELYYA